MARPKSYPAILWKTCRRCRRDLAAQYYRRGNRTCSPCLDGRDPPSPDQNHPQVPASHRSRRRSWPEGVVFTGPRAEKPAKPLAGRATECQWCGAALPVPTPGPGRPRRYCDSGCRAAAVQPRRVLRAFSTKPKRARGRA